MRAFLLVLLLVLPLAGRAQADDPEAVRAVLEPALVAAGLDASLAVMAAEFEGDVDTEALRADVIGRYTAQTSIETARAFAAWTERPDVAPFLAWERETATEAFQARLDAFRAETGDLDLERLDWTDRFLHTSGYLDFATDAALAAYTVLFAAIEAEEAGEPLTAKVEARVAEKVRVELYAQARAEAEAELYDVYYLAFEDATPDQREAFLRAVAAPEAAWYFRTMPRVMTAAVTDEIRRLFAEG